MPTFHSTARTGDHSPEFLSAPTSCQFAKGGQWEKAWGFSPDSLPSPLELEAYIAQSNEIAFEAFFGHAFFGARKRGSAQELIDFCMKCLKAIGSKKHFFDTFRHDLGCPVADQPPDFAEIGCVNAWRSIGALRIHPSQLTTLGCESIWHATHDSPVGRDSQHAKAIEFAFSQPLEHWLGLPISVAGESNLISKTLLRQTIESARPP
jgi:hypothetical protein